MSWSRISYAIMLSAHTIARSIRCIGVTVLPDRHRLRQPPPGLIRLAPSISARPSRKPRNQRSQVRTIISPPTLATKRPGS